ncbi:hypothetical protein D3C86_1378330 [compost metagenome]
MRMNHLNGLLLGLAFTFVASGCSTAPTAAPATPAPVQPIQQVEPTGGAAPVAPAPLAADPCNPCDGVAPYGPYGAPYGPYGAPYGPYGLGVTTVFFDPFAFNSVVFDTVVVNDRERPRNVIRDTTVDIAGSGNQVVIKQGGHGGSRIDTLDIAVNGDGNSVKINQGGRRR